MALEIGRKVTCSTKKLVKLLIYTGKSYDG